MTKTLTEQIVHIQNDLDVVFAEVVKLEKRLVSKTDESVQKMHILEKQLEIATKALKIYDNKLNWDIRGVSFMKYNKGFTLARKALKEIEGVK